MQPRLIGVSFPDNSSSVSNLSARQNPTRTKQPKHLRNSKSWQTHWRHTSAQESSGLLPSLKQRNVLVKRRASATRVPATQVQDGLQLADGDTYRPPQSTYSPWANLPQDILRMILGCLGRRDLPPSTRQAEQDVRQNLMSVQNTCRAWCREAQNCLYQDIYIHDSEPSQIAGRPQGAFEASIVFLRKTLRSRQLLAHTVRSIHIVMPSSYNSSMMRIRQSQLSWYSDLAASLVMSCPNLEKLTGVQSIYNHKFDKLVHALSTRIKLKQYSWLIGEDSAARARARNQLSPGILDREQAFSFLDFHIYWKNLERLRLTSHKRNGILEHAVFAAALRLLPSLKHLHIVGFDVDDFTDQTLLALPTLTSLRLEHCLGVSDEGLCRWTQSPTVVKLQELRLIHQDLVSLLTISTLFSRLPNLQVFHLVQDLELSLPLELPIVQPLLTTESLLTLRWEVPQSPQVDNTFSCPVASDTEDGVTSSASIVPLTSRQHLILSYMDGGLPSLRSLHLEDAERLADLVQWACRFAPLLLHIQPVSYPARHSRWSTFYSQQYTLPTHTKQLPSSILTQSNLPSLPSSPSTPWPTSLASANTTTDLHPQRLQSRSTTSSSLPRSTRSNIGDSSSSGSSDTSRGRPSFITSASRSSTTTAKSTIADEDADANANANANANKVVNPTPRTGPLRPMLRAEDTTMNFDFEF